MPADLIILPRTDKGRALLRSCLRDAFSPDRPPGELPDGTSIFGLDFDEFAIWLEKVCEEDERLMAEWERDQEKEGG